MILHWYSSTIVVFFFFIEVALTVAQNTNVWILLVIIQNNTIILCKLMALHRFFLFAISTRTFFKHTYRVCECKWFFTGLNFKNDFSSENKHFSRVQNRRILWFNQIYHIHIYTDIRFCEIFFFLKYIKTNIFST